MAKPKHPIVMLWAHPRSMSTATERIMRERGDFHCMHEPFMYYYYVHLGKKRLPHFEIEAGRPSDFNDILTMLFESAQKSPVFSKDMAYYVLPEIYQYPALANNLSHFFLVRDPRRAILSYHKLDPDLQCDEVGIESQWQLFRWIKDHTGTAPMVMCAEDIQDNPQGIIGAMWQQIGLEFIAEAFEWNREDTPEDWQQVNQWHHTALTRRSIKPQRSSEWELQAAFEKAVNTAPQLQHYLDHHMPFYAELVAAAERSLAR